MSRSEREKSATERSRPEWHAMVAQHRAETRQTQHLIRHQRDVLAHRSAMFLARAWEPGRGLFLQRVRKHALAKDMATVDAEHVTAWCERVLVTLMDVYEDNRCSLLACLHTIERALLACDSAQRMVHFTQTHADVAKFVKLEWTAPIMAAVVLRADHTDRSTSVSSSSTTGHHHHPSGHHPKRDPSQPFRIARQAHEQAREWTEETQVKEEKRTFEDVDKTIAKSAAAHVSIASRPKCPRCGNLAKEGNRDAMMRKSDEGTTSLWECSSETCPFKWSTV